VQVERKNDMAKECIGLVLEAGGARGAYECGAIKALYKHYPHFQSNLRVISAASSGAFNGTVLVGAKGDPVSTIEQAWRERFAIPNIPLVPEDLQPYLTFGTMGVPGMGYMRPEILVNPFMATSVCDNTPLRQTLEELVDVKRINNSPIHLIVAATDVETGELVTFENKNRPTPFTFDMVLASGSIAPVFPMTNATEQVSGKEGHYWDGGFIASLPLSPAINALEQCYEHDEDVKRVLIVVQVHPLRSRLPRNMSEVLGRFFQLLISSKLVLDQELFDKMDAYIDLAHLIEGMKEVDKAIENEIPQRYKEDPAHARRVLQAYRELKGHKKIDFIVIQMTRPESLTGDGNFSRSAIEDRIECGYEDAFKALRDYGVIKGGRERETVLDLPPELVEPKEGKAASTKR
jgi:NTE family protein